MKRGKKICDALKEVRMQVAKANDIKYAPTECHHEGDCAGTCPKCESEVRWLEQQLQLRRQLGKAVAVVGVSGRVCSLDICGRAGIFGNNKIVIIQGSDPSDIPVFRGDANGDLQVSVNDILAIVNYLNDHPNSLFINLPHADQKSRLGYGLRKVLISFIL